MDTLGAAEPIRLDAELRQCLFYNPGVAAVACHQDRAVRDTARQEVSLRSLIRRNQPPPAQVGDQGARLLNVQLRDAHLLIIPTAISPLSSARRKM
jgi:hypothetical protein